LGLRRGLALAWLAAFGAAALWLALQLPHARLETSIFELVPWKAPNAAARAGAAALRSQVERRVLVLVGAADPAVAGRAAEAYAGVLKGLSGVGSVVCAMPPGAMERALACFEPHRFALLSSRDRAALAAGGDGLLREAEQGLYLPSGFDVSLGFSRDPFGSFGRWLAENAALSGSLSLRDGHLEVQGGGLTWVAVSAEAAPSPDEGARRAQDLGFEGAAAAARAQGASGLLRTGFLFHEHAAAAQARREVGAVGALSTGLLALLLWVVFRRARPMLLALLPAAVGCVAGAAAVLLLWSRVHAVALVFGSTVVGVADDYGLYFLSGLYDGPWDASRRGRSALAPLALAMATSVLGYAVLALLPIPGLKQVAVFATVGLAADWAGVVLWYPILTRRLRALPERRVAKASALRLGWPRWGDRRLSCLLVLALVCAAAGCMRLRFDDDVRLLYAHDAALDDEQARAQALTGLGGTTGFFVVQAATAQQLLGREEALRDALASAGSPTWTAVSDFVPSLARQEADRASLERALFGPPRLAARLAVELGQPSWARGLRRDLRQASSPLTPEAWLADPASAPWRRLWLPQADGSFESLVLPGPGLTQADLARLAPLAAAEPGAQYVDQLQAVSALLAALRRLLAFMLAAGTLAVFAVLGLRLGPAAFAAAAPAVLGAVLALGALGFAGLPLNLFVLLALLLLLGTAVDFGIYMQDGGERLSSFVAVQVAALTNIAAVGVLAFSGTPALRAFGLVLGVGALGAWLCAPCFAPTGDTGV
jgi:predicted exporter